MISRTKTKLIYSGHTVFLNKKETFDPGYSTTYSVLEHYYGNKYKVIRNSLYKGGESRIYLKGIRNHYVKIPFVGNLPDALRYVVEVFIGIVFLCLNSIKGRIIFIAINPLSCFPGAILKKFGFDIKIIFLTPDFAEKRFNNPFLNKSYFAIDKFCTKYADYNYCYSKTVIAYKRKIYYDLELTGKLIHYPTIPPPWLVNKYKKIKKVRNKVIYVGNISNQLNFKSIIRDIYKAQDQIEGIYLELVGGGDSKKELEKYVLENKINNVFFTGNLPYEESLRKISEAEVGIALYNGSMSYDRFRDSCKIREYQAFGVIPLTSDVVRGNVDEIKKYNSGIIINEKELIETIHRILKDKKNKSRLKKNCFKNYKIYSHKFEELNNLIKAFAETKE